MAYDVRIDLKDVTFNNLKVDQGIRIHEYESLLGKPDRCSVPGWRLKHGHIPYDDNVVYLYDLHGIALSEHRATQNIHSIYFIFNPAGSRYQTNNFFSGDLSVLNTPVRAGMRFEDFSNQCDYNFTAHLGHAWFLDSEGISIQFEVKKAKGKRGLEKGLIQYLCVGFRGAHEIE